MTTETVPSADGTRLNCVRYGARGPDVLVVHGQGEHAGRYQELGTLLGSWGYRATIMELRGHGHSEGVRNHVRRWSDYGEDIHAVVRTLGESYALVAHSMGGLAVLDYLRQGLSPQPVGLVLSDPLVGLAFTPPVVKVTAARLLSGIYPELALPTELDTSLLSRDKEVVRRYDEDPLINRKVTVRWFTEMVAAMARVRDGRQYTIPLLMLIGTADGITSPAASTALFESWAGPRTLHRYEGWYHEIFNEPERARAFEDVRVWLQERLSPQVSPA